MKPGTAVTVTHTGLANAAGENSRGGMSAVNMGHRAPGRLSLSRIALLAAFVQSARFMRYRGWLPQAELSAGDGPHRHEI